MKYIKKYEDGEEINPQIGDYVLINLKLHFYEHKREVMNFINNTIGQIINVYHYNNHDVWDDEIRVKYDDVPDTIKSYFSNKYDSPDYYSRQVSNKKIVEIGKTLEEVQFKISQNKFNL
jgi:phenylalanyl-tRNA synthetase beta subunit